MNNLINLYGFTYPQFLDAAAYHYHMSKDLIQAVVPVKLGDEGSKNEDLYSDYRLSLSSEERARLRIDEQGDSTEAIDKQIIGIWTDVLQIHGLHRDHDLRKHFPRDTTILTGAGKEWILFPYQGDHETTIQYIRDQISNKIEELQPNASKPIYKLNEYQQEKLDEALNFVDKALRSGQEFDIVKLITAYCPRYGKTGWILLFTVELYRRYSYRHLILAAFVLSSLSSFEDHIFNFRNFREMFTFIRYKDIEFGSKVKEAVHSGQICAHAVSLHTEELNDLFHIRKLPHDEKVLFADEGDFGAWTDLSVKRIDYMLGF